MKLFDKIFEWFIGRMIDWLFKDEFMRSEFEREHGWHPTVGPIIKIPPPPPVEEWEETLGGA